MNERRVLDANVHASSVQQRKGASGRPDETANGTEGRSGGAVEERSPSRIPYRKGERNVRTWWRAQRAKGGATDRRDTLSSARPEDNRSHSWRLDL
ncbi:hypothetical protein TIFTF001_017208 [Ficus carica]|uniref:Uncharacterized protein n=1 Tax=Ficus carica TaxID=3494 RepID=A0AA88A958_FICCA|nr:hypothetical protein TIFTF001_017208 [Ficus carica]